MPGLSILYKIVASQQMASDHADPTAERQQSTTDANQRTERLKRQLNTADQAIAALNARLRPRK